jgi:hypothetical protein
MLKMIPHPQVAHIVGTSLAQLDATYSHYMPSGEQYGSAIDAYIGKAVGE